MHNLYKMCYISIDLIIRQQETLNLTIQLDTFLFTDITEGLSLSQHQDALRFQVASNIHS